MTCPELREWLPTDRRYRRSEISAVIGRGLGVWARASWDVLRWRVKTASGFTVDATDPVSQGKRVTVKARLFIVTVVEPVEVVAVVAEPFTHCSGSRT
jgi:uncharacterized protein (UPF0548 family)